MALNIPVMWLVVLHYIPKLAGTNLGTTHYSDCEPSHLWILSGPPSTCQFCTLTQRANPHFHVLNNLLFTITCHLMTYNLRG